MFGAEDAELEISLKRDDAQYEVELRYTPPRSDADRRLAQGPSLARFDFAQLEPFARAIPTRLSTTYRLDLLSTAAAAEAIAGPAARMGTEVTPAALHHLLRDLARVRVRGVDGQVAERPGLYVEPVQLQVVCRRLWAQLGDDRLIRPIQTDNERWREANLSLLERLAREWANQHQSAAMLLRGGAPREAEKWRPATRRNSSRTVGPTWPRVRGALADATVEASTAKAAVYANLNAGARSNLRGANLTMVAARATVQVAAVALTNGPLSNLARVGDAPTPSLAPTPDIAGTAVARQR